MRQAYLVTGCAGFLGSNLVGRMLAAGHEVVGIDNLSMGRIDNIQEFAANPRFRFLQARRHGCRKPSRHCANGPSRLSYTWRRSRFRATARRSTRSRSTIAAPNARSISRAGYACKRVLASTSDVYGRNPALPFSEESTDHVIGNSKAPRWAYAVSKLFDEHLALAYQDAYGFPVTLLRFFGSYGPNQNAHAGGAVRSPVFIDCVLNDKPIPIHGDGSADAQLHLRDRHRRGHLSGDWSAQRGQRGDHQHRQHRRRSPSSSWRSASSVYRARPASCGSSSSPTQSFTGKKYEDVMRRVPDVDALRAPARRARPGRHRRGPRAARSIGSAPPSRRRG